MHSFLGGRCLHSGCESTALSELIALEKVAELAGVPLSRAFCPQVMSSVLFLTAHGGPTVVLEQGAADGLAPRGFRVMPAENKLLCFPGSHLHGVLPGAVTKAQSNQEIGEEAILKISMVVLITANGGC